MIRRHLLFLSFLPGCICCLVGCKPLPGLRQGNADVTAKKVIFLAADGTRPLELSQRESLAQLAAGQADVVLQTQKADGDARKQAVQLLEAAAARPFAIIIEPVDASISSQLVTKSGILVIGLGGVANATGCTTTVACDEAELGRLAGKLAVETMTRKAQEAGQPEVTGRVVEIRGDDDSAACAKRHDGFVEALKAAPGLILVHDAPGGWTREGGLQRIQDAFRLQKSFDVVYAHNDLMALGAAQGAGLQRPGLFIIGTDGLQGPEGGLALTAQRQINATIYQPPVMNLAWAIIRKKIEDSAFQPKAAYQLIPRALLPENAAEFLTSGPAPEPAP